MITHLNYEISIQDDTITITPTIPGVDIEAHIEDGEWVINDGYQTVRRITLTGALDAVIEAIDYYAETEDAS